ncbi:MAG TPA: hypothetical protein VNW50_03285 [Streptosporangiaceae bacterium]|nr:hypothetical protein [Streptosporangiaceae bacterium]
MDIGVSIRSSLNGIDTGPAVNWAHPLEEHLTSFVTYDKRLADAAEGAGLRVDMPAQ